MTTKDVPDIISAEVLQGDFEDRAVKIVYTSDLLSDVLANGRDASVACHDSGT